MWEEIESRELHRSGFGCVKLTKVKGPGGPAEFFYVDGPPIALVVPVKDDGRIVLVKQHRPAWGFASWECPAGHAEPGESPKVAARRELAEETGYCARRVELLLEVRAGAKIANPYTLFTAGGLEEGPPHPDSDEEILVADFTKQEIGAMIARGEIVHAPSLVALLLVGVPPRG